LKFDQWEARRGLGSDLENRKINQSRICNLFLSIGVGFAKHGIVVFAAIPYR
jgi:hypothetical protein